MHWDEMGGARLAQSPKGFAECVEAAADGQSGPIGPPTIAEYAWSACHTRAL